MPSTIMWVRVLLAQRRRTGEPARAFEAHPGRHRAKADPLSVKYDDARERHRRIDKHAGVFGVGGEAWRVAMDPASARWTWRTAT